MPAFIYISRISDSVLIKLVFITCPVGDKTWLWFVVAVFTRVDRDNVTIVVKVRNLLLHFSLKLGNKLVRHLRLPAEDAKGLCRVCPAPPGGALFAIVEERICLIISGDDVVVALSLRIRFLPEVNNEGAGAIDL